MIGHEKLNMQMDHGQTICDKRTLTTAPALTSQKPNHNLSSNQTRKQNHNLCNNQPQTVISLSPNLFQLRTNQRKLNMLFKPIISDNHSNLIPVSPCHQPPVRENLKLFLHFIINYIPLPAFESVPNANDGS